MKRVLGSMACLAMVAVGPSEPAAREPLHERIRLAPPPEWVVPDPDGDFAGVEAETEAEPGREITYLLADIQVRVPEMGSVTLYTHHAYRIDSRTALEDWSSWEIEFEPTFHSVDIHHLRVLRDGAWEDRFERSRKNLLQRESELDRHVYDQRLSLVMILDDVRVGDVVSASYSVHGRNPVLGNRYSASYDVGWSVPVARQRLRFITAPGHELAYRLLGGAAEPSRRPLGTWSETLWESRDLGEFEEEPNAPRDWRAYPGVQVTEYGSWSEVVDWAEPLYRVAGEQPAELRDVAETLRGESADPLELTVRARDWVQDEIRYFAVLLGEHSHAPHRPREILSHRYGDCKDKTVVLLSLLRALGIEAWPALVHTRHRESIDAWLPSPDAFDHVIVTARPGDHEVWIDPTLSLQGGTGTDLYVPPYGKALVVRPGEDGLTDVPASQAHPGVTRIVYRYDVPEPVTPTRVEIVSEYERQEAEELRTTLMSAGRESLLETYVEFYSEPGLEVTPVDELKVLDDRTANRVTVTERYTLGIQADPPDAPVFETLPLLMESDLPVPETDDRRAPFALPFPLQREEVLEIRTPQGWELDQVTESEENPWFRFHATSNRLDSGLQVTYRLETLTDRVPPGGLGDYRAAVERTRSNLGYIIGDDGWSDAATRISAAVALIVCAGLALLAGVAVVLTWRFA